MNEASTASLIDINSNSQGMPGHGGQASTMAGYVRRYVAKDDSQWQDCGSSVVPWLSQGSGSAVPWSVCGSVAHPKKNQLDLSAMMRECGQSRLFLTVGSPRVIGSPEVCSRLFPKPGMTGRAGDAWYEWQSRGALHTHTMHGLSPRRGSALNAKESDIPLVA